MLDKQLFKLNSNRFLKSQQKHLSANIELSVAAHKQFCLNRKQNSQKIEPGVVQTSCLGRLKIEGSNMNFRSTSNLCSRYVFI